MKLRNLPLYACAMMLTVFMLSQISIYHSDAIEAATRTENTDIFVDESIYENEDAVFAFAVQQEERTDFCHPFDGECILAFASGTVEAADDGIIMIAHNDELSTCYLGCAEAFVSVGDMVDAGCMIAKAGEEKNFEVFYRGEVVDASLYLALTARP